MAACVPVPQNTQRNHLVPLWQNFHLLTSWSTGTGLWQASQDQDPSSL
jgi:hypothetical protein